MKRILALTVAAVATLGLTACGEPKTPADALSEGGIPMGDYVLVGIGQDAAPGRNILLTLRPGSVSGSGPCNSYRGTLSTKFPQMRIQEMTWTDMGCKLSLETRLEQRYFEALTQANTAVWEGGVLKLVGSTYLTFEPGRPATLGASARQPEMVAQPVNAMVPDAPL